MQSSADSTGSGKRNKNKIPKAGVEPKGADGASGADADTRSSHAASSSGCMSSVSTSCHLTARVINLEKQMAMLMQENAQLRDKGAPAGLAKSKADGALLAICDVDAATLAVAVPSDVGWGKVDAATLTSLETLTQQAAYWGKDDPSSNLPPLPPVPAAVLIKAIECEKMGLHRAGPWFSIEQGSYGMERAQWGWIASVRDRGCHQFGQVAERVLARRGGHWKVWSEGRVYFNARLVCQRCTS